MSLVPLRILLTLVVQVASPHGKALGFPDVPRAGEPIVLDVRLPTDMTDKKGKRFMAEPLSVLIVDPQGGQTFFSLEDGTLPGGKASFPSSLKGRYQVYLAHPRRLACRNPEVREGDELVCDLDTENYPDGTPVVYDVCREEDCLSGPSSEAQKTTLQSNRAALRWRCKGAMCSMKDSRVLARAWVKRAWVRSEPVPVKGYPLTELRGVQQFLRRHQYSSGEVSGVLDAATRAGLEVFQKAIAPCMTGVVSETEFEGCGFLLCQAGGLYSYPIGEHGKGGPVTQYVMQCLEEE